MGKIAPAREKAPASALFPKPFIRWAGGKRRLADILTKSFPEGFNPKNSRYFEPFIGGGALMFALGDETSERYISGKNVYINDSNPDLIATYKTIKVNVEELIRILDVYSRDTSKLAYESMRKSAPADEIHKAARFIYLNKTCFNGLWRVNSRGEFNVPWGKLKKPTIFTEENLLACHRRLSGSKISCGDFVEATNKSKRGDLVYFDPPYLPLSPSSSFSKYSKDDFTIEDHKKLAKHIEELTAKGVYVILSNSDTELSRDIFRSVLSLRQIPMNRSISAASASRKSVMEIVGTNFLVSSKSPLKQMRQINRYRGAIS